MLSRCALFDDTKMGRGDAGVVGLSFFGGDWAVFGRNGRLRALKGGHGESWRYGVTRRKKGFPSYKEFSSVKLWTSSL